MTSADVIISFIFVWEVLVLTNSPFLAGLMQSVASLPIIFSAFTGYYVHKSGNYGKITMLSATVRIFLFLWVIIAIFLNYNLILILSLFIVMFLYDFFSDFENSAYYVWYKIIMPKKQYQKASSLMETLRNAIRVISIFSAGFFLLIGFRYALYVSIIVYALAIIPIGMLSRQKELRKRNIEADPIHTFKEGLSFVGKSKVLKYLLITSFLVAFSYGALISVISVYIKISFNLPSYVAGIFLAIGYAGTMIGMALAIKLKGKLSSIILTSETVSALLLLLLSYSNIIYLSVSAFFLIGLFRAFDSIASDVVYQKAIPADYISQISGIFRSFAYLPGFMAGIIFGAVMQFSSARIVFIIMAAIMIVSVVITFSSREIRKIKLDD